MIFGRFSGSRVMDVGLKSPLYPSFLGASLPSAVSGIGPLSTPRSSGHLSPASGEREAEEPFLPLPRPKDGGEGRACEAREGTTLQTRVQRPPLPRRRLLGISPSAVPGTRPLSTPRSSGHLSPASGEREEEPCLRGQGAQPSIPGFEPVVGRPKGRSAIVSIVVCQLLDRLAATELRRT